jgi:hypothetical protein
MPHPLILPAQEKSSPVGGAGYRAANRGEMVPAAMKPRGKTTRVMLSTGPLVIESSPILRIRPRRDDPFLGARGGRVETFWDAA